MIYNGDGFLDRNRIKEMSSITAFYFISELTLLMRLKSFFSVIGNDNLTGSIEA